MITKRVDPMQKAIVIPHHGIERLYLALEAKHFKRLGEAPPKLAYLNIFKNILV